MKKIKLLLVCLCFAVCTALLGTALLLTGCDKSKHEHDFGGWEITTPASCTATGVKTRTCSSCGETETEVIDKIPHAFSEWLTTHEFSCTEDGEQTRSCSVCHLTETKVLPASHTIVTINPVEPTCTEDGHTGRKYCSVCGFVLQAEERIAARGHRWGPYLYNNDRVEDQENGSHHRVCRVCEERENSPCTYDTVVTQTPTCTLGGYNTHTCIYCQDSFTHDHVPELGHQYPDEWTQVIEDGVVYHQKVCGRDSSHVIKEVCDQAESVVTPPSCTAGGYTLVTCSTCHLSHKTSETPATDHSYDAFTHVLEEGVHYHKHTCSECQHEEKFLCTLQTMHETATCTRPAKTILDCPDCHYHSEEETSGPLPHSYGDWLHDDTKIEAESQHYKVCSGCGDEIREDCSAYWTDEEDSAATCTAAGVNARHCSVCSYTYKIEGGAALGHSWSAYTSSSAPGADGLGGKHTRHCLNGCGTVEEDDCVFDNGERVEPDCEHDGYQEKHCNTPGCTNTYHEIIDKLGHQYDPNKWDITVDNHTRTCIRQGCGISETKPHDYSETNFCSACQHDGLLYELENGEYTVVSDNRVMSAPTIIIPAQHNGFNVTKIGPGYKNNMFSSFLSNHTIKTLVLPQTLKWIEDYAFNYCTNLTLVYIDGEGTEGYNPQLVSIGASAFESCSKLASAKLPSSLKTLGNYAFNGCSSLREISLPDTLETIGIHAFRNTAFVNDPTNWTGDALYVGSHLVRLNTSFIGVFEVQNGTITICENAFENCVGLTGVVLPDTLTEVDQNAFLGCTALAEVEFDGSYTDWLNIKFVNDYSSPMHYATELHISETAEQVYIPSTITHIPAGTFKNTNIKLVDIPASVTSIGSSAFEGCSLLETITIHGTITSVGANVLTGTKFYNTKSNWTGNGGHALYLGGVLFAIDSELTILDVEDGTTAIAAGLAEGNKTLRSATFNAQLVYIGERAFKNSGLETASFTTTRWFAKTEQMMGRILDVSANIDNYAYWSARFLSYNYTGEWIRSGS